MLTTMRKRKKKNYKYATLWTMKLKQRDVVYVLWINRWILKLFERALYNATGIGINESSRWLVGETLAKQSQRFESPHITFCFSCNESDQSWKLRLYSFSSLARTYHNTYNLDLGPDSDFHYLSFRLFFDPFAEVENRSIFLSLPFRCFIPRFTTASLRVSSW